AFSGRTLFFKPFTHYLRGVVFVAYWTTSASRVVSFAHQLYNGEPDVDFDGIRTQRCEFEMSEDWRSNLDRTSKKLCDRIERDALPPVAGIVDYVQHLKSPAYLLAGGRVGAPKDAFTMALGACTVGDFAIAEVIMRDVLREFAPPVVPRRVSERHR